MKLPVIPDPNRFVGLYVYDFGKQVSVGYTAAEVRLLQSSPDHRDGTAYEIYRVTESGGLELRGASGERLLAREAIAFLRDDLAKARGDYNRLRERADHRPIAAPVELLLTRATPLDRPYATALLYPVAFSPTVAAWLGESDHDLANTVLGGGDVHALLTGADAQRIESCDLPACMNYADRPLNVLLRTTDQPLQR